MPWERLLVLTSFEQEHFFSLNSGITFFLVISFYGLVVTMALYPINFCEKFFKKILTGTLSPAPAQVLSGPGFRCACTTIDDRIRKVTRSEDEF